MADVRGGQRWRKSGGDEVSVDENDGQTVQAAIHHAEGLALSAAALAPKDFDGMLLLYDPGQPYWRVTVDVGIHEALIVAVSERVGTVEGITGLAPRGDGRLGPGPMRVLLVAPDEEAARRRVVDVLPEGSPAPARVERLS